MGNNDNPTSDLRDRLCPHIETGDDGTPHCRLAESANTAWVARAERAEMQLAIAKDYMRHRSSCSQWTWPSAGGPDCDCGFYDALGKLAVPVRPGGTDNPTSNEPRMMQGIWPAPAEGRTVAMEDVVPDVPTGGDDGS